VKNPHFDLSLYEKVFHNKNLILYRRETFAQVKPDEEWEYAHQKFFAWHDGQVYCKLGGVLLVSVHITSKYPQNERLGEDMFKKLH